MLASRQAANRPGKSPQYTESRGKKQTKTKELSRETHRLNLCHRLKKDYLSFHPVRLTNTVAFFA